MSEQSGKKPPLTFVRIVGEVLVGEVCAGLCLVSFFLVIVSLFQVEIEGRDSFIVRVIKSSLIFVLPSFGAALGNAIGVYLVGNIGNETGSFRVTLIGSILGAVIPVMLVLPFWIPNLRVGYSKFPTRTAYLALDASFWGIPILGICTIIGAITGFNRTRRYY